MTKLTTVVLVIIVLTTSHNEAADLLSLSDDATIIVAADESWEDIDQDTVYFRGNIEIQTPGWALMADHVTVYGKLEDAERIVADGSPLHFIYSNSSAGGDTHMEGEGLHLEYLGDAELLTLYGNATLTGEGRVMHSSEIRYDLEGQKLEAGGPEGVSITIEADTSGDF